MSRSKAFLSACLSFISGVFVGSYFSVPLWVLFLAGGFLISLVFLCDENRKLKIILFLLVFVLAGFIRVEENKLDKNELLEIGKLDGRFVSLEGVVSSVSLTKNGKQKITVGKMKNKKSGERIKGKALVYLERYPEYHLYDKIRLVGKINTPENFENFEYRNYLFSKDIYYVLYYPKAELVGKNESGFYVQIANMRRYADDLIKKIFPAPQASVVSAMTLAIKAGIDDKTLNNFNRTGTRHIIAISGLHITTLVIVLMYLLLALGIGRNYAFYFSIAGIAFFVLLVGAPPSAVRAAIMGGVALLAVRVGRLANAVNAVILAGCLMLLYYPALLRYDTGFQLSFAAVLGIVYIFPKLNDFLEKKCPDVLGIRTIFLITASAQAATLPIIMSSFGNFSLFSVFANVLILPFVPIVMLGGFILIVIGSVNLFAAQVLSWPIWLILSYQINVIGLFANLPSISVDFGKFNFLFVALYYIVLTFVLNFEKVKEKIEQFCKEADGALSSFRAKRRIP